MSRLSINDLDRIQAYCSEPTDPTGEPHPSWQWNDSDYVACITYCEEEIDEFKAQTLILVAELREARSIIAFFADEQNWQSPSSGFALQYNPNPSPVQAQGQQIARDFLEE